jgi:hypothetical protein
VPVTDAYADFTTYKLVIAKADALDDAVITDDLMASSRYLDRKMGRFFTKDAGAVARIFYPDGYYRGNPEAENPWRYSRGSRELVVDDIADKTGLVIKIDEDRNGSFVGETALATTDYELWPRNADKGPEPKPWRKLLIPIWSTRSGWPAGSIVEVTAVYGYPAIPKAIIRATIHIAAILRFESPFQATGDVDASLDQNEKATGIIASLAHAYKRNRVFA